GVGGIRGDAGGLPLAARRGAGTGDRERVRPPRSRRGRGPHSVEAVVAPPKSGKVADGRRLTSTAPGRTCSGAPDPRATHDPGNLGTRRRMLPAIPRGGSGAGTPPRRRRRSRRR